MLDPAPSAAPPPVVLVHGFASSFEHNWVRTGWAAALESRGHEVIGLDLPGHGGSDQPGGGLAAAAQLTELAGRYPVVDLVGFSAGARVCAAVAASGTASIRRLVLAGLGDGALRDAGALGPAASSLSLTGPLDEADLRSALFRRMAAAAGNDPQALEAFLAAPAADITAGLLARIPSRTLVIIGERDWLGPATQVMASLPDGRLVILPRADHFAAATHVEAMLAALRFLQA